MRIAFAGKPGSGKDECVRYLLNQVDAVHLKFAHPLYEIADQALKVFGLPLDKTADRAMLGAVARWVYGRDRVAMVRTLLRRVDDDPRHRYLVSDLRDPYDADRLREAGFRVVRIVNPRIIYRDEPMDTYTHYDDLVLNDGSFETLHRNVDDMCARLWP